MRQSLGSMGSLVLATVLLLPSFALAQTPAPAQAQSQTQAKTPPVPSASDVRPATTTFMGDTGLWNVPTAETLPDRKWSASAYRVNFDDNQGFSDISNWPITFGYGLRNRAEIFGSFVVVSRIDRDLRPLFLSSSGFSKVGGVVPTNPLVHSGWTGNELGDLWLGGKINFANEFDRKPVSFAIRPMLKVPTGSKSAGTSTGKVDFALDAVVSKELQERAEVSGYAGFIVRGKPSTVDTTNGFRWGVGAGLPSRTPLLFTAEVSGEVYTNKSIATKSQIFGDDGSFLPSGFVSDLVSPVQIDLGLTYRHHSGFFAGAGWTYRPTLTKRSDFVSNATNGAGDRMDIVGRIGYHPGVRIYVPPPPPQAPPPPPAPQNHPPTVRARCEPCTVYVGKTSTVTADASDPDGDTLTYAWSAPAGTFTNRSAVSTPWTAPMQEGPVPVTVSVSDGKGGTASDAVTIQVIKEAVKEVTFEDVHFDFDRYSLRPEALRVLDEAIRSLQGNPTLKITIEGHTCNIGTAEYNLALGERRANAVRDYLLSRGVGADRMQTVSYGEERPKFDNSREETRRLNRRAALVVRLQ
jgi:peptidoglycan-associated lipoprotein